MAKEVTRCPGTPGSPCGHPLDQRRLLTGKPLTSGSVYMDLSWPEWSPCDEGCHHGGELREDVTICGAKGTLEFIAPVGGLINSVVEARGRHPVEVDCPECVVPDEDRSFAELTDPAIARAADVFRRSNMPTCSVCDGTGRVLLCATCAGEP